MTNLQALTATVEPYTASALSLELALSDVGLTTAATYSDKTLIAKAAISVLKKFLSLSNESEGGFSQGYNPAELHNRIAAIVAENGLSGSQYGTQPKITSASNRW